MLCALRLAVMGSLAIKLIVPAGNWIVEELSVLENAELNFRIIALQSSCDSGLQYGSGWLRVWLE